MLLPCLFFMLSGTVCFQMEEERKSIAVKLRLEGQSKVSQPSTRKWLLFFGTTPTNCPSLLEKGTDTHTHTHTDCVDSSSLFSFRTSHLYFTSLTLPAASSPSPSFTHRQQLYCTFNVSEFMEYMFKGRQPVIKCWNCNLIMFIINLQGTYTVGGNTCKPPTRIKGGIRSHSHPLWLLRGFWQMLKIEMWKHGKCRTLMANLSAMWLRRHLNVPLLLNWRPSVWTSFPSVFSRGE